MSRKKSREILFQILFSAGDFDDTLCSVCEDAETPTGPELNFIRDLFKIAVENMAEIDEIIKKLCIGFTFDRLFKTDLCALRLGIAEIKYTDTNRAIVINEAVELAKRFGTEKSGGFVNGILAKVEK